MTKEACDDFGYVDSDVHFDTCCKIQHSPTPARQADGAAAGWTRAPGSTTILPSPESEVVSVETTKVIPVKSAKPEIVAIEASHSEAVSVKSPEPEVIAIEAPHREAIIEAVHAETKPVHH